MAPAGLGQIIVETWIAERMRTSRNKWLRRTWWIVPAAGEFGNLYGIGFSLKHP